MKIKHIALVALTALALGLAGAEGSEVAGSKPGVVSGSNSASIKAGQGDFRSDVGGPASASIRGGASGDFETEAGAPAIAGAKPGVASGTNNA